jgi:hypothetical protein
MILGHGRPETPSLYLFRGRVAGRRECPRSCESVRLQQVRHRAASAPAPPWRLAYTEHLTHRRIERPARPAKASGRRWPRHTRSRGPTNPTREDLRLLQERAWRFSLRPLPSFPIRLTSRDCLLGTRASLFRSQRYGRDGFLGALASFLGCEHLRGFLSTFAALLNKELGDFGWKFHSGSSSRYLPADLSYPLGLQSTRTIYKNTLDKAGGSLDT